MNKKGNPLALTPEQEFWLALDRERFNVAYREKVDVVERVVVQPRVVKQACRRVHLTPKTQEAHDQMMFNAGRFAAGAVDRVAVEAHEQLMRFLDEDR